MPKPLEPIPGSYSFMLRPLPLLRLPEQPLVSVLMASYNYEAFLERALDSVLAQTYPHWECIVCDDGSTDASRDIAARYARRDGRVQLTAKPNAGVASALNAAYQQSTGVIICLLDADDFFSPDKLMHLVQGFLAHPEAGMVFHAMQVVDAQGQVLYRKPVADEVETGWIAEQVVARGGRWRSMPTSALAFHRTVADHLFPIPEETFRSEADGFLYTLAPLLTPVAFLREPLAGYRLHGDNLTGTTQLDATGVTHYLDVLRRTNDAVNERLDGISLQLERHLNYQEHYFMDRLFSHISTRQLLLIWLQLAQALLRDDLYSPSRKMLGLIATFTAIWLPPSRRAGWLTKMLQNNTLKRIGQQKIERREPSWDR